MGTLKKWKNLSKLGSQPPLKSAYPGSCRPKKLFLGRFFLENHFFDPFRPNEDPQVLYMAGKLWISSLWCIKKKIFFCTLWSVWFSMTVRTDIFLYTEKLSYRPAKRPLGDQWRLKMHPWEAWGPLKCRFFKYQNINHPWPSLGISNGYPNNPRFY